MLNYATLKETNREESFLGRDNEEINKFVCTLRADEKFIENFVLQNGEIRAEHVM
jgi:hypothetical protein